jgi:DNA-binding NarL/FixJ family response regulator
VAGAPLIEITGPEPWPIGLREALPRRSAIPIRIMITPQPHARCTIADLQGHPDVLVWATDPSAVEAAVLIAAGANAYVTEPKDLAAAVEALNSGEAWLAPVAAAAVCRLARNTRNPAFDKLSVAARTTAGGQAWLLACRATGLTQTRYLLTQLRREV